MKIKDNVILSGLNIKMRKVLIVAENLWQEYGEELVVTSGLDGIHSAGSLHYYGLALDFRTRYFPKEIVEIISNKLQKQLGTAYLVLVESNHIHVQYILNSG